jgi:mycofactocin precursor
MNEQTQQPPTIVVETPSDRVDANEQPPAQEPELVADDLLVEDVSIDGMCGVY